MTDSTQVIEKNKVFYVKYVQKIEAEMEGFLGSNYDDSETLARFESELVQAYGPDGYSIVEFRPATEEELAEVAEKQDQPAVEAGVETPTVH